MTYINGERSFNISWNAPSSLVVLLVEVPDITYCITISNSSDVVSAMCGITDTHYSFQQDFNPCVEHNVTVTSVNQVGNGSSSQPLSFPSKIHYKIIEWTLTSWSPELAGHLLYASHLTDNKVPNNCSLLKGSSLYNLALSQG